jgi:hypothetical protein
MLAALLALRSGALSVNKNSAPRSQFTDETSADEID